MHDTSAPFHPSRTAFALLALFALVGIAACGTDAPAQAGAGEVPELDPVVEELYRVGNVDGTSWDAFSRITSMAFGTDGVLHVLDAGTRRIHRIAPDGTHLGSFGRQGDGPGEFRSPAGVAVLADGRIVVADAGHPAFMVFAPDGTFLESRRMEGTALPGNRLFTQGGSAVVADARSFRFEGGPGGMPAPPTTTPVRRWELDAPAGGASDGELILEAWRPVRDQPRATGGAGGMAFGMAMARAFEPQLHLAVLPDGRLAVADSSAYAIRIFDADGGDRNTPVAMIGRDIAPRPVGPAEEEAERTRQREELEAGGGPQIQIATAGPGGGAVQAVPQAQVQEMLEARIASMEFWHELPVIRRLAADADGRLWVERSAGVGEVGPTDILIADGTVVGTIRAGGLRTPVAFGPGGLAAWLEPDELEVPFIRVGRVRFE